MTATKPEVEVELVGVSPPATGGPDRGRSDRADPGVLDPGADQGAQPDADRGAVALWRCGAVDCGSPKLSHSSCATSTCRPGRCRCVTARAIRAARSALTSRPLPCWPDGLTTARKLSPGARAPVFCTLAGGRVDSSYVRHLLPRLAAKTDLERRGLGHTRQSSRES